MTEYMLERAEVVPIKAIGNTSSFCDYSHRWKQIAMSDDLEALTKVMGNQHRIIDRSLNVITQTFKR